MEVTFKRNVGDSVWVITDNKIQLGNIEKIYFYDFVSPVCQTIDTGVKYSVRLSNSICEIFEDDQLFSTKEELIKTL